MPDFIHVYNQGGGIRNVPVISDAQAIAATPVVDGNAPLTYKFPGFTVGRLLASLVAGATATRVGLTVTVTATAHGILTWYDGAEFFFPGCPSLAAGWYPGFAYVSANSVRFSLPPGTAGGDFAGESINGGAAHLVQTRVATLSLQPNALRPGSKIGLQLFREVPESGNYKYNYFMVDSDQCGRVQGKTSSNGPFSMSAFVDGNSLRRTLASTDADAGYRSNPVYKDLGIAISCSVDAQIDAPGEFVYTAGAFIQVTA